VSEEIIFGLDDLEEVVRLHLVPKLYTNKIFTFQGPLGAGKTTVIKELLKQCGVKEIITSPTFTYVKQYKPDNLHLDNLHLDNKHCKKFYHFDLYRLTSLDSFLELGFDEYLNDNQGCSVIEWPEIIFELLTVKGFEVLKLSLKYLDNDLNKRVLKLKY
jgi:tRNA threonylcarbamoyladenosine biosynthesis protein TsaE